MYLNMDEILCIFKNWELCEMNEINDTDRFGNAIEFIFLVKVLCDKIEKINPENLHVIDDVIIESIALMKKFIDKYMEQNADRVFIKKLEHLNEMSNDIEKLKAFKK